MNQFFAQDRNPCEYQDNEDKGCNDSQFAISEIATESISRGEYPHLRRTYEYYYLF